MSWEFEDDLSGVNPAVNRLGTPPTESGPYQVKVEETELRETQAGNQRVAMFLLTEGPKGKEGFELTDGLNIPSGAHADLQRRFWVTFFLSLGYAKSKLNKKLTINPKLIEGKTGYIYFTSKDDNAGSDYYDVKWLTEKQYHKMLDRLGGKKKKKAPAPASEEPPVVDDEEDVDDNDPLGVLDI